MSEQRDLWCIHDIRCHVYGCTWHARYAHGNLHTDVRTTLCGWRSYIVLIPRWVCCSMDRCWGSFTLQTIKRFINYRSVHEIPEMGNPDNKRVGFLSLRRALHYVLGLSNRGRTRIWDGSLSTVCSLGLHRMRSFIHYLELSISSIALGMKHTTGEEGRRSTVLVLGGGLQEIT